MLLWATRANISVPDNHILLRRYTQDETFAFLSGVPLLIIEALTFRFYVNQFDEHMTSIGYAYKVGDTFAYVQEFGNSVTMHILCERVQYADVWITSEQSSVSASTK